MFWSKMVQTTLGLETTKVMGQGKTKPQRNAMGTDCPMREKTELKDRKA